MVVGVVYCPVLDELFVAVRGEGATLNGRPISVSQVDALGDALFCTEIGVSRDPETVEAIFARIRTLTQQVRAAHHPPQFQHLWSNAGKASVPADALSLRKLLCQ